MANFRMDLKSTIIFILFGFILIHVKQSDAAMQCICPRSSGYVSYTGSCSDPTAMFAVKRTLLGKTPDTSNPNFCSSTIQLGQNDCIVFDLTSSWPVRSTCDSIANRTCLVSYTLDSSALSACSAQNGYVYGCLEYDCVSNTKYPESNITLIYLSADTPRSYITPSKFQILSSYYPSTMSDTSQQCSIRVAANIRLLIRIWDLRARFIGSSGSANQCPYNLYINSGTDYKSWCANSNNWMYTEFLISSLTTTADRYVDIVFYSTYPVDQTEGAVWLTVESNSQTAYVVCGSGIPLYNTSGHASDAPSTSTSTTTTTRTSSTTTTTTTTRSTTTTTTPATTSTTKTTTTTTTRPGPSSSSTTRPPPGPPGPASTAHPAAPSTSTTSTTRLSSSTTTTTKTATTTTTTKSLSSTTSSTTRSSSSTTTKQPAAISSTTTTSQGGVPTGPAQASTTTKQSSTTSGTTRYLSQASYTPGVPTPGVPPDTQDPNAVETFSLKQSGSNSIKTVAITVAVIVGGLVLLAFIVMFFVWFCKMRHEDNSRSGLTEAMDGGGEENHYYE